MLRPSLSTNTIVKYCLAHAAEETGVLLHAVCVMSNHWHGVVTDSEGRLPEFLARFHLLLAKTQNTVLGRSENFWSSDKTSVVLLVDDEDVLDKMAYVLANPVAAGLVRSPHEWPGVISLRAGTSESVEMPDVFFDEEGALPDEVELQFARPHVFGGLSDAQVNERLSAKVTDLVRLARASLAERGLPFVGRNTVLRQAPSEAPTTPTPLRNPSPRIAARSRSSRVHAIRQMQEFVRTYREAWLRWCEGDRGVTFPLGTYALRVYGGVSIASAAPS